MELTKKQSDGLKIALERYRNGEKYTVISGYAGTGKSTLIKFIISAMGLYLD
jgi:type IV secretory pathway VirB4 component